MTLTATQRLTREQTVLVALLGAYLDRSALSGLEELFEQVSDWKALETRATEHGLAPLLAWAVEQVGSQDPERLASARRMHRGAVFTAMRLEKESRRIMAALAEADLGPIVLKGPAVAHRLYAEPWLRLYADLDLLVSEADWPPLREALLGIGGVPEGRDMAELPARLSKNDPLDHWFSFRFPGGFRVECAFDPLQLGVRMRDGEGLQKRSVPFEGWAPARRLAPEDELVVLALHLNRHGFQRLIWLLDLALLVQANPDLDWSRVGDRARDEGVAVSVHHTLRLVGELLGVDVSEGLRATRPRPLASRVWRHFWGDEHRSPCDGDRDGPLVFRKGRGRLATSEYLRLTAANLLMTGRVSEKAAFFALKAFPPAEFLRARYGRAGEQAGYTRLWLRRLSASRASSPQAHAPIAPRTGADEAAAADAPQPPAPKHERSFNRAIVWNATAKFATRGMQFIVTIVLARLLVPADFGLANMANVVTGLIVIFAEFGFAYALMQKLKLTDEDISTAWTISVLLGAALTVVLLLAAPFVAGLFHEPSLAGPLRLAALGMLIVSFAFTPSALLARNLDFRSIAIAEFSGNAAYGLVAIGLALAGGSVWSLVVGSLAMFAVRSTLFAWRARQPFRPRIHRESVSALLPFGSRVLVSNGFEFLRSNMDYFIVGRALGPTALGLYEIAFRLTDFPRSRLGTIVSEVAFPTMSSVQHHAEKIRHAYGRSVYLSGMLTLPVLFGLAVISREFVLGVYGPKWVGSVAALQVLLVAAVLLVSSQSAINVLLATGRPSLSLRLSVLYATCVAGFAALGARYGLVGVATGVMAATAVYVWALQHMLHRHTGIGVGFTLSSLLVPAAGGVGVAMALAAYRAVVRFPEGFWQLPWLAGAAAVAAAVYLPLALPSLRRRNADVITLDTEAYTTPVGRPSEGSPAGRFVDRAVNQD